jgi:hypothetical protein
MGVVLRAWRVLSLWDCRRDPEGVGLVTVEEWQCIAHAARGRTDKSTALNGSAG